MNSYWIDALCEGVIVLDGITTTSSAAGVLSLFVLMFLVHSILLSRHLVSVLSVALAAGRVDVAKKILSDVRHSPARRFSLLFVPTRLKRFVEPK